MRQTNRGVSGVCVVVSPRVQSKLSRVLHANRGKKLLQVLQNLQSTAMKRATVRFVEAREKGTMAFVECLGILQEDTMEGPLWRDPLRGSLGSHDTAECVGRMCHGNDCRQETTRLHTISCKRRDGALSPTIGCSIRHWLDSFARETFSLLLKICGPSEGELADKTAD